MLNKSLVLIEKLGFIKSVGINITQFKNTKDFETVQISVPETVQIVMQQHIGTPCDPTVKKGDEVKVGQLIGDSDEYVSAPIHSSVSGKVSKIEDYLLPNGIKTKSIIIEADGLQSVDPSIKPPTINNDDDLLKAVRNSGLVGLGGAGFPTHVKLNLSPELKKRVDMLIINAAECEPYITSDVREILECHQDIFQGIKVVSKLLDIKKVMIAIEDNKAQAIEILSNLVANINIEDLKVTVKVLPSNYPQGAEKVLIKQCTGRQVPQGKLPVDVGVIVLNVTSLGFLARYLRTGMPLVSKRITVDGSAVCKPKNVFVPIGTSIKDIIDFCGGYKGKPFKILCGGPMMGTTIISDESPILKQNNAILAFGREFEHHFEESNCIRCARCVNACPMNLMPTLLEQNTRLKRKVELEKLHVLACMECGCCSFSCPANRKLVQSIKIGKKYVRE